MKCEDFEAKLLDYIDGSLSETEKQEIENHLERCEKCLDELMHSQQVLQLFEKGETVKPDDTLRINFYHMLHNEIKKSKAGTSELLNKPAEPWHNRLIFKIAAGIAILICGTFAGLIINSRIINSYQARELSELQSEVSTLKKTAMYAMLKNESSSNRIQAVSYADEFEKPDDNIINALVTTLNNDKNVNVRMAAAYALSKFTVQQSVSDSLVRSLSLQSDPIVQITLINILVEHKEKTALKPIESLINNKSTLSEVKTVAENGLQKLQKL
jgi:hypothetical protein